MDPFVLAAGGEYSAENSKNQDLNTASCRRRPFVPMAQQSLTTIVPKQKHMADYRLKLCRQTFETIYVYFGTTDCRTNQLLVIYIGVLGIVVVMAQQLENQPL